MKGMLLNNYSYQAIVGKNDIIKMDDMIPKQYRRGIVAQEITSDFVLEIYEKAKKARSEKRKKELHKIAEELSKHVGSFLVE